MDTGATDTFIDAGAAERLKLTLQDTDRSLAGVNGIQPLKRTSVEQLSVASVSSKDEPYVREFTEVNEQRKKDGLRPFDGFLGNNFLLRHDAVIDHTSARLFLKSK